MKTNGNISLSVFVAVLKAANVSVIALQRSTSGKNTFYVARVTGTPGTLNIAASGDLPSPQQLTF